MDKNYATYNTEYGVVRIEYDDANLVALKIVNEPSGMGIATSFTDSVYAQLSEYLAGKRKKFDISFRLDGTAFQKSVWGELIKIPYGEARTYRVIAIAIGKPKACRAVGLACKRNPIWLIVPCHRVIGESGKLTGYAGGIEMKRKLLKLESDNILRR